MTDRPILEFVCEPGLFGRIPPPAPAARFLPDWFRSLPREMGMADALGLPGLTARACLPMSDAMAMGWIIPLPVDVWTARDPDSGKIRFDWDDTGGFRAVEAHHPDQIGAGSPPFADARPLKFRNPWRIVLAPGWSAAFVHPLNHFELPFTTFAGAVDCDALEVPVNVPFLWTAQTGDRRLPAGTPMVQVIPYRRADLQHQANVRCETVDEIDTRVAALVRKHTEVSVYAREWRGRQGRAGKES